MRQGHTRTGAESSSASNRSLVVIDPKGELTAITARFRRQHSDVVIINPFGVLGIPGCGFNPLAALDPKSPHFLDDAAGLGEALIKIEEKDPHWSESAQGMVVAFIMWEVIKARRDKRPPLLDNVRRMMTESEDKDENGVLFRGMRYHTKQMIESGVFELESLDLTLYPRQ